MRSRRAPTPSPAPPAPRAPAPRRQWGPRAVRSDQWPPAAARPLPPGLPLPPRARLLPPLPSSACRRRPALPRPRRSPTPARALLFRLRSGPLAGDLTPSRLPPPISLPCRVSVFRVPVPRWPREIASSRGARVSPGPVPAGRFRAPGRPRRHLLRPDGLPRWGGCAGRRDDNFIRRDSGWACPGLPRGVAVTAP